MRTRNTMILTLVVAVVLVAGGAQGAPADSVRVDMSFGADMDREARELVGVATTFAPDVERIWCLTRIEGLTGPTSVTHAWYPEGQTMARVDLPVNGSHWRTWSSKLLLPAWTGTWEVKVLDADGTVLHTGSFEIR